MLTWLEPQPLRAERPSVFPSPFDDVAPHPLAQRCAELVKADLRHRRHRARAPHLGPHTAPRAARCSACWWWRPPTGRVGFLRAVSGQVERAWNARGLRAAGVRRGAAHRRRGARGGGGEGAAPRAWTWRAFEPTLLAARAGAREARRPSRGAARGAEATARGRASRSGRPRAPAHHRHGRRSTRSINSAAATTPSAARAEAAAREERAAALATLFPLERRLAALERLRRVVSQETMRRIWDSYRLTNFAGERTTLRALFPGGDPPSGAADCAAPQAARRRPQREGLHAARARGVLVGHASARRGRGSRACTSPRARRSAGRCCPSCCAGLDVGAAADLEAARGERGRAGAGPPGRALPGAQQARGAALGARARRDGDRLPGGAGAAPLPARAPARSRCTGSTSTPPGCCWSRSTREMYRLLQAQFLSREVHKRYVAVLEGTVAQDEGRHRAAAAGGPRAASPAGGGLPARQAGARRGGRCSRARAAAPGWRSFRSPDGLTSCASTPRTGWGWARPSWETGCTGTPAARLLLHAEALRFRHPLTGEPLQLEAPAPF